MNRDLAVVLQLPASLLVPLAIVVATLSGIANIKSIELSTVSIAITATPATARGSA